MGPFNVNQVPCKFRDLKAKSKQRIIFRLNSGNFIGKSHEEHPVASPLWGQLNITRVNINTAKYSYNIYYIHNFYVHQEAKNCRISLAYLGKSKMIRIFLSYLSPPPTDYAR